MREVDVIVPVLNEAENVSGLTRRIDRAMKKAGINYGLIFVDDGSSDDTVSRIEKLAEKYPIKLHLKEGKAGKAFSILEGSRISNAENLVMIDGDLQYPPEVLPEMLALATEHGVVVANRSSHKTKGIRKIASKVNNYVFGKLLLNFGCDTQSGLKVFKREIIEHVDEKEITPWTLDMVLLKTAVDLGYSVGCVEIEFAERLKGSSKIRFFRDSKEIAMGALKLKTRGRKVYKVGSDKDDNAIGAGVVFKKKRYITHTRLHHERSALVTFKGWQKMVLLLLASGVIIGLAINARVTGIAVMGFLTAVYFLDLLFSLYVLLKSLHFPPEISFTEDEIKNIKEGKLPVYSILCPLYKEAKILPHFLRAIAALDWPKDKLEVLLLLEENDDETLDAAKRLVLPSFVKVAVVPHSLPKTKPKACNYGLEMARGEYVVIYDAEDIPDPLQLKKAYLAFQKVGGKVFCLQSKLNYYNTNSNLLTRLFTAEYSLWFDVILPGLQSIEAMIPLGGTSNHFRVKDLKELHAWDPFNVTEDCDLGVRLFKEGYKTAIIDSTTLEEANSNVKNWIRQRSRWIKGYFQTYFVHMREPVKFFREHGVHALIFQLVVGMRMTFIIINPLLWIATLSYFALYSVVGPAIDALYPTVIFYMAVLSIVFGNFIYLYNYMIGCAKREQWGVVKYVFLVPFYWALMSWAATVALYQLIIKPHYWEKTHHGLHLKAQDRKRIKVDAEPPVISVGYGRYGRVRGFVREGLMGGGILIFSSVTANFMNFLYNAYLGRSVNLEEFGTVSVITSIISVTSVITGSFGKTVVYKTAYLLGKYKKPTADFLTRVERWGWIFSFILTVLWVMAIPFLSGYFNSDLLPFLLFAPALSFSMVSSVYSGYLWGNLRFSVVALLTFTEAVTKLIFAVLLVEAGAANLVYASIPVSSFIAFLISWYAVSRIDKIRVGKKGAKTFPFSFLGASVLTKISGTVFLSLDVILAKHFLSPANAGRYALLSLSGKMVFFLGTLFGQFIIPLVSTKEGEGKESRGVFYKLLLASLSSSLAGLIFVGFLGSYTLPLLFGENAYGISRYSLVYGYAMLCYTISSSIVTYHQIKGHNLFPILAVVASVFEGILIFLSPKDINGISTAVAVASVVQLVIVSVAHVLYSQVVTSVWFVREFVGLFLPLQGGINVNGEKTGERILIFNWRDTRHMWAGGAEVYVHELAKRWVAAGNKVTLFCGNDGKCKRNEVIDGVTIIRRGGFYTVYLWSFLYYIFKFRGKYDVIVESENGAPFFTPFYSRKPVILVVHHMHQEVFRSGLKFPLSVIARFVEIRLMPFVYKNQKVVTVSESSKKDLVMMRLSKPEDVDIVNPGIDGSFYRRKKKTSHPQFMYMGRLKAYKNIDVAIKAFSIVSKKHPEAKLMIAGEGEEDKKLMALVKDMNLNESVEFCGRVTEEKKAELLGQSWASLQPSSFEGWGITVLEANACGTAVIASKVKGLCDSVVDGVTGILVPVKNVELFARAMLEIIENEEFRNGLSEEAYKWSRRFEWDIKADEFMKVINKNMYKYRKFGRAYKLALLEKEGEMESL